MFKGGLSATKANQVIEDERRAIGEGTEEARRQRDE